MIAWLEYNVLQGWKHLSWKRTCSYLHNGFAMSHTRSQNQTMCLKIWQLVSDATLKRTIQASMCLSIAGVLRVCTYQAWRRPVDQGWRRHPHGWYCATWRVALICGSLYASSKTEIHCKQCNYICRWLLRPQHRAALTNCWHHLHRHDYLLPVCK